MHIINTLFFLLLFPAISFADNTTGLPTTQELLDKNHNAHSTTCAGNVFSNALIKHSDEIDESEPEFKVRAWAHNAMTSDADVLKQLLKWLF